MTQAKLKPLTFAEFLERNDVDGIRYDLLADGNLVAVPSEAGNQQCDHYAAVRRTDAIHSVAFGKNRSVRTRSESFDSWGRSKWYETGLRQ